MKNAFQILDMQGNGLQHDRAILLDDETDFVPGLEPKMFTNFFRNSGLSLTCKR
jgi:hypothetical protein